MSQDLTRDAFAEQRNTKFKIYFTPDKAAEAELVEVSQLRTYPRQEIFALVFLFPPDLPAEQRIYRMEHDALGALEIFLVPFEKTADGAVKYEAVFNRLIASE